MTAIRQWVGDFDLGQFLGIGLDTAQIGYLAGALFLALFALSAVRRAKHAAGPVPAVWLAVAIGLFAAAGLTAARGFPDQVPDELRPWTDPDRLLRAAAVAALLCLSLILLSAHWVRNPGPRFFVRTVGLAACGLAIWLAAGWFGDQLPDEARPWTARPVVTRILALVGLLFLAGAFWRRPTDQPPHRRWAARMLAGPAAALAVVLTLRWFGRSIWSEIPVAEAGQVAAVLGAIAAGTCGLIALGAYVLRDRPAAAPVRRRPALSLPVAVEEPPLPVAILLDAQGRPVLPVHPPRGSSA